ncbi:MAG: TolC family protein [Prevotella sp.]|nr:TolC family protein [Prevotella sp.]
MKTSIKLLFLTTVLATAATTVNAQSRADDSGISAGFFDSSVDKDIYFSTFKLPPLAVLFENAKSNPSIMNLSKAQELAHAEYLKQKKHIFSYISGHASYSYGKTDSWSNGSDVYTPLFMQFQGSEQSYWNVGVNLSLPLEDILDLGPSVKRRRLAVEQAQIAKDIAYDNLKLEIATLYVKITNNLTALKTAGENAAIYQGAAALNEQQFHHGNFEIEDYAFTGQRSQAAVQTYQGLLTQITIDIITLEIMTHTPIITNTTTEITLDEDVTKSEKQIARENKAVERRIRKAAEEDQKREEAELKQAEKEAKALEKEAKKAEKANK